MIDAELLWQRCGVAELPAGTGEDCPAATGATGHVSTVEGGVGSSRSVQEHKDKQQEPGRSGTPGERSCLVHQANSRRCTQLFVFLHNNASSSEKAS